MQLGRYEVLRKLGEGGMARVLLAKSASGDLVVLKVPFSENADFAERVRDEARVGLRVHHPSVVDTLDLFEHDGRPILVVEYVEGASLQQLRHLGGPMPAALVARVGRQVAEALAFIHDATDENNQPLNILHRDVAPGNILVTQDGNAKLIDLGIARGAETKAKKTQVGTVRGTMRYLAPELLAGETQTPATDLWALGVVLFEAALGRRAAEGDEREVLATIVSGDIAKLREGESLDPSLQDVLSALLAPAEARLQRARAAVNVLKRIEGSLSLDEAWAHDAVGKVLARIQARWAASDPSGDISDAATVVRTPNDIIAGGSGQGGLLQAEAPRTAAPTPAVNDAPTSSSAPVKARTGSTDPRPKVEADEELGHSDGAAPTVRMSAVELAAQGKPSGPLSDDGRAPTALMPALHESELQRRSAGFDSSFDDTERIPRAQLSAPVPPEGSSSLAWRNVAAPTLLGVPAADVAPKEPTPQPRPQPRSSPLAPPKDAPRALHQEPSAPVIAAEPDETTEAGAPHPSPVSGFSALPTPAVSRPSPGPALQASKEPSGPVPRMPRASEEALRSDTEQVPAVVSLPSGSATLPAQEASALPVAAVEPRSRLPSRPAKAQDPAHRAPDQKALGIATRAATDANAATPAPQGQKREETMETAFPYGVPDSLTPSAPVVAEREPSLVSEPDLPVAKLKPADTVTAPKAPAPGRVPRVPAPQPAQMGLLGDSDATMRMPPAPRAGFIGQAANPEDATERVRRPVTRAPMKQPVVLDDPFLSGELAWKPNRTKHIAIAAGVVVALAVAVGVLFALDVF